MKDLSPKFNLKPAFKELEVPPGTISLGERIGGMQMYSTSFKRGYGENTFGVDDNGLWFGAADFENAPIKMDRANVRILINDGTNDRILIGKDEGGF